MSVHPIALLVSTPAVERIEGYLISRAIHFISTGFSYPDIALQDVQPAFPAALRRPNHISANS
ncbi:MAG: hypothetical protein H7Y42_18205 [Chitinophagaceae bacterium]|nr:hypothetical protein [Chitinophagaceae bacterium]